MDITSVSEYYDFEQSFCAVHYSNLYKKFELEITLCSPDWI